MALKTTLRFGVAGLAVAVALSGCTNKSDDSTKADVDSKAGAFASTYKPAESGTVFLSNATVLDGIGGQIDNGQVLIVEGKIKAVGTDLAAPDGATTIDAKGGWITPGIIDVHSHLGNYPSPGVAAHADGNEITSPITSEIFAEHGVWPQDPGFDEALAGGVTTLHVLPGSANLFGGRGVTLRNVASRTVQGMKMPNAPYTLKMACGENPKRVYGARGGPGSRMGNFSHYRKNWIRASEYKKKLDKGDDVTRDLQLETLAGVLSGEILFQMHCYRADEMAHILDLAKEFDYKVSTFHHAVEAYKIADILKETDTCSAVWADWWGFKMEAYDSIRENLPFLHAAGACAMIHSDSENGIQRLNQEVAKALSDGNRAGLNISKAEAWVWLSSNPAKALGISEQTGSLEEGKRADVVIWDADPFSTYSRPQHVFIDGVHTYEKGVRKPKSDFRLGQPGEEG